MWPLGARAYRAGTARVATRPGRGLRTGPGLEYGPGVTARSRGGPVPTTTPIRRVAGLAAALLLCAGTGAAAGQAPPAPQTERFRLVLEGDSHAVRDLDLGGSNGICNSTVNVHVDERATWQRGTGVTVEFIRLGTGSRAPVLMRRVGSRLPVFTVAVAATRTSSGSASRTPSGPPEACPPATEDLSKGPDCGTPQRTRANISLTYAGQLLKARLVGLGAVADIACPVSQIYGGTPDMRFSWPTPVQVRPEVLAPALVFGTRRAFVVRMQAPHRRLSEPIASGPLTGSVTDFGDNRVIIRFIRLP